MALNGIFAKPPSGSSGVEGSFGNSKLQGAFAAPPPAIDQEAVARQQAQVDAAHQAQVSAANSKYANSFGGIIKSAASAAAEPFVQGFNDASAQAKPKSWNPITIFKNGAKAVEDAFGASLDDAGQKIADATSIISKHPLVATGEIGLAALSPIFTAATAPLTYATAIPGVGHVADKVNEIFAALGSGVGAHVATAYVDDNPYLSQETKDTIRPLVHDSAALVAQLVAGKLGGEGIGMLGDKTKQILGAVSKDVKDNPPSANPQFQASEPTGTLQDRLNATADKPLPVFGDTSMRKLPIVDENAPGVQTIPNDNLYTAPEDLPVINMGRTPSSDLPTIQAGKPASGRIPGLTYEPDAPPITVPVKPITPVKPVATALPDFGIPPEQQPTVSRETVPAQTTEPAAPAIGSASAVHLPEVATQAVSEDRGVPKLSSNVESKAIAQNLAESFGDLPEYDKVNWQDQGERAQQLLSEDPAKAHRIALGQELPPDGLLHGAVFDAVERQAFKNGDIQTILRLSRDSTLGAKASRYGQEIAVLGMRDKGSPVKTIDAVKKARVDAFEKKTGKKAAAETSKGVKEIKSEIKDVASKSRPSWEEFMSNLTCNI